MIVAAVAEIQSSRIQSLCTVLLKGRLFAEVARVRQRSNSHREENEQSSEPRNS